MFKLNSFIFWSHLTLGITVGCVGALMAVTGVIMAFADSYVDLREHDSRRVEPPAKAQPLSLEDLAGRVSAVRPDIPVNRIGLDRESTYAYEFYHGKNGLDYVDPYSGKLRPSDSVTLRRSLHKGVEKWHRFFGRSGDQRDTAKFFASWFNVALIPLLFLGLVLWWPNSMRWAVIKARLIPTGGKRRHGTERSWHTSLGFWVMPLVLIMVATATTHSFEWVRKTIHNFGEATLSSPGVSNSIWAPRLPAQSVPFDATPLTLDQLRMIADKELPGWTRLDIFPAAPPNVGKQIGSTRLLAKLPGRSPAFFPVVLQVHPYTGEVLDVHSWADLSGGTQLLAWSRWLHKGEAFGRAGQIVAGLACLAMLVLIYTGWAQAIRRLMRGRKAG